MARDHRNLAGDHDVGHAVQTVDHRRRAAGDVVELVLGGGVVDVDSREERGGVGRSGGRTINGGVRVVFELTRGPVDEDLDWRRVLRARRERQP